MELQDFITLGSDVSYRDVLSEKFYSEYFATKDCPSFLAALRRYKQISKADVGALQERILALKDIVKTLDPNDSYQGHIIRNIFKKDKQLRALKKLFDLQVLRNKKELYNPDIEQLFKSDDLLNLKNDYIYDFTGQDAEVKSVIEVNINDFLALLLGENNEVTANEIILDKATREGVYKENIILKSGQIIPDYFNDKSILEKILTLKAIIE